MGDLDSADVWLARAMRDTTQGAGSIPAWLPAALTELRLDQGRLADAGRAIQQVTGGSRGRRATAALLHARLRRATGDTAGAAALLETELRALSSDGHPFITVFARPFVVAGEWRLATGDTRGADSLADLAWKAALVDSLARTRSAYVGRTALLRGRIRLTLGDSAAARLTVRRALVALTNGYGPRNRWTLEARALSDSLTP